MIIDPRSLQELRFGFAELGRAVGDLSSKNKANLSETVSALNRFKDLLDRSVDEVGVKKIAKAADDVSSYTTKFSSLLDQFSGYFAEFDSLNTSLKVATESFTKISKDLESASGNSGAFFRARTSVRGLDKAKQKKQQLTGMQTLALKEGQALKGKFIGAWSSLELPKIGAVAAGLIGIAALGFKDADRVAAEAGEIKNILVTATDGTVKGVVSQAKQWVSGFQESLQKFYGISREEPQKVLQTLIDGGNKISEILGKVRNDMGMVGKNWISYTLGIDKMLEVAGGTTAQRAIEYQARYGQSLKQAGDTLERLALFGQLSGTGTLQFMKNIEAAGESLDKLGFSLEGVIDMAYTMQKAMEKIGVPQKFAGRQIALGVQQMASGIANMSSGWQAFMAEKLGYGSGVEGKQKMMDAQTRLLGEKGGSEEYYKFAMGQVGVVANAVGGNEAMTREILQQEGWGFQGAKMAFEQYKTGYQKATATQEEMNKFKEQMAKTYETEREKQSKFERMTNEWMKGLAKIGQGIMGLVGDAISTLIAFFRSIPALIANALPGAGPKGKADNEKIYQELSAFMTPKPHLQDLDAGDELLKTAGIEMIGDMSANVAKAMMYNPMSGSPAMDDMKAASEAITPTSAANYWKSYYDKVTGNSQDKKGSTSTVLVPYPVEQRKSVFNSEDQSGNQIQGSSSNDPDDWVGTGIEIVSGGVDQLGNINLGVSGDCPRCGLNFGGIETSETMRIEGVNKPGSRTTLDMNDREQILRKLPGIVGSKIEATALDPKIANLLQATAKQFPGKPIRVYQASKPDVGQTDTHKQGKALDLSVEGVPNEDLFKFLKTQQDSGAVGGLGYYPNSSFVHADVRPKKSTWVDTSGKGQKATYVPDTKAYLAERGM